MKSRLRNKLISYLPAYLNQTLSGSARLVVALWLRHDTSARAELAQLGRLQDAIKLSARREAPEGVLERVRQQVHEEAFVADGNMPPAEHNRLTPRLAWVMVVFLALLAGAVAWLAIPPVISLEWSVSAGQPSEFRVYRARLNEGMDTGTADYKLLNEIPADANGSHYRYADLKIVPGQRYLYRVEALDVSGAIVRSNTTLGDSVGALPGQLVLLAISLLLLYGLAEFSMYGRRIGHWSNNDLGFPR